MASDVQIVIAADAEAAAQEVAELLARLARGGGHVALTGGRTPRRAYELAAQLEPDWGGVTLWWGDERCVPPDDERSNYAMAKAALLDSISPAEVHRIHGELGRERGANRYDQELQAIERFDLVLLGLGSDGHVASLFPGQPTLDVADRRAVGAEAHLEPFVDRITLTRPALETTELLVFLVAGADKADAVRRAFTEEPSNATPGSLVRAAAGQTIAVLDEAAATNL